MLPLASARCPQLRELYLWSQDLDQPPAPLAHLTRLSLFACSTADDGVAQLNLATAAPRLEVLEWIGSLDNAIVTATKEHPRLNELRVGSIEGIMKCTQAEAWLCTIRGLPALSSLVVEFCRGGSAVEELEGAGRYSAMVLWVCERLGHCTRLEHLDLDVNGAPLPVSELLAAVGAAAGRQLTSLTLQGALLPRTRAEAERSLHQLVGCYPQLEVLKLQLSAPRDMAIDARKVRPQELLLPVPGLVAVCPALREVQVGPKLYGPKTGIQAATWLRPSP